MPLTLPQQAARKFFQEREHATKQEVELAANAQFADRSDRLAFVEHWQELHDRGAKVRTDASAAKVEQCWPERKRY